MNSPGQSTPFLPADWPLSTRVLAGTILVGGDIDRLPLPGAPTWLNQVHGSTVVDAGRYAEQPDADACIGRRAGDVCVIRSADCLPVLFATSEGTEIAAAHAGWRGLAAGVLENTVAAMESSPSAISVWFGPAISATAFEVGDEVRDAFVAQDPTLSSGFVLNSCGRWQADLYALAAAKLAAVGVDRIYGGGLCTHSDDARFHSYRRDPDCGRLLSVIAMNPMQDNP